MKKILIIVYMVCILINLKSNVYANDLDNYIDEMQNYTNKIDLKKLSEDIIENKGIEPKTVISSILNTFLKEVVLTFNSSISIVVLIILVSLLKTFEISKNSGIIKVSNFVCILTLSILLLNNYKDVMNFFKDTSINLTTIMQVISPFLMGVLIATGKVTTVGIIQPLLLFLTSIMGYIITNLVIPFLSLSISLLVISSMNDNLKLNKLAKIFNTSVIWIIGIIFTVFLGILALETSITTSVDGLAIKTASAAVSNFVPVVGKIFSDSLTAVVGASQIVGKTSGVIGIIVILVIMAIPIIKIVTISVIYKVLTAILEPICDDSKLLKIIDSFSDIYKTMAGVLFGIGIIFIISIGVILNIYGSVVGG